MKKSQRAPVFDVRAVEFIWSGRVGWLLGICLLIEILLVLGDLFLNMAHLTGHPPLARLFNITREDGLASWFGVMQTFAAGLTAWLAYRVVDKQGRPGWRRAGWCFVAVLLLYLAIDDGTQIHERVGASFQPRHETSAHHPAPDELVGDPPTATPGRFPSYGWQVLFVPGFALAGLVLLAFLWQELQTSSNRWLLLGALACLAVAVGLDFLEGLPDNHPWNVYVWIIERVDLIDVTARYFDSLPYATIEHFSKSLEEFLEMVGISLLWAALLRHLRTLTPQVTIRTRT